MDTILYTSLHSGPFGILRLVADDSYLRMCDWVNSPKHNFNLKKLIENTGSLQHFLNPLLKEAIEQLDNYFNGKITSFNLPLLPVGSDFQLKIWSVLQEIQYGETRSYSQVAIRAGNISKTHATASAIAWNPISIFIPCHRVISKSGNIGKYAGGTAAIQELLYLERSVCK